MLAELVPFVLGTLVGSLVSGLNVYLFVFIAIVGAVLAYMMKDNDNVVLFVAGLFVGALAGLLHHTVRVVSERSGWYWYLPFVGETNPFGTEQKQQVNLIRPA